LHTCLLPDDQSINSRRKQTWHLFQGRYKALLIDAGNYLLQLTRYIHNKPVRAEMVPLPSEYRWSSHNAYRGTITIPWLTTDFILQQFAKTQAKAIAMYNQYQLQSLEKARKEFHTGDFEGRILGNERFIEEVMSKVSRVPGKNATLTQVLHTVSKKHKLHQRDL
jgi:putative transposase